MIHRPSIWGRWVCLPAIQSHCPHCKVFQEAKDGEIRDLERLADG